MKTTKEMKESVKEFLAAIPEKQFVTGSYVTTIGRKYVNFICTWNGTEQSRMTIEDFYLEYVA